MVVFTRATQAEFKAKSKCNNLTFTENEQSILTIEHSRAEHRKNQKFVHN